MPEFIIVKPIVLPMVLIRTSHQGESKQKISLQIGTTYSK